MSDDVGALLLGLRQSLGGTFKRALRRFILPVGHNPNTGPVIVLDGNSGLITIIGSNGSKMTIGPNLDGNPYPQISFFSADGTRHSWLNAVTTVANPGISDPNLVSAHFTPDGFDRRFRLDMSTLDQVTKLEVINDPAGTPNGGYSSYTHLAGTLGFNDNANDQNIQVTKTGVAVGILGGSRNTVNGDDVSGQVKTIFNIPSAGDTTTSGTLVNMAAAGGGSTSVNVVKRFDHTALLVLMFATMYATTSTAGVEMGVLINGTDNLVGKLAVTNNLLNNHTQVSGSRRVQAGLANGTYSVQARWRRTAGTGTLTRDTDDLLTMAILEVDPS